MGSRIMSVWINDHRPGYFGRKRDKIVNEYNSLYGKEGWRLRWVAATIAFTFEEACVQFYEKSYYNFLKDKPEELDFICSHGECIDNAPTNVQSGLDYTKQESYSTHIQDIAVRNVLTGLGRKFLGPPDKILVIRSADSNGYKFGPGNIPCFDQSVITQPSLCPTWAGRGSVEDFWQSNKWVQVLKR
jgi:hypothetical protein